MKRRTLLGSLLALLITPAQAATRELSFGASRVTLDIGDKATGTTVLTNQYNSMRLEAVTPDLKALWRNLGITADGKTVSFDDNAPMAATRRAIETPL